MNEQQLVKSEQIASKIMRILAIIGLVSILAIIAWLIVQGFRLAPNSGERMSAAVSSLTAVLRGGATESLALEISSKTVMTGSPTELRFVYNGTDTPTSYQFSYTCAEGVMLSVQVPDGNRDLACATPFSFDSATAVVVFSSTKGRYADTELLVTAGALKDAVEVTVVNASLAITTTATTTTATTSTTTKPTPVSEKKPSGTTQKVAQPKVTKPRTQTTVPAVATTPGDLSIRILETGLLIRSRGEDTLVPLSPVPSNKTAAVTFTVTNRGGKASGAWAFVANLPIEGDPNYRYVSPAQASLAPGAEVTFTLGFDEILEAKTGTIKIELVPTTADDKTINNTDAVRLDIKKV